MKKIVFVLVLLSIACSKNKGGAKFDNEMMVEEAADYAIAAEESTFDYNQLSIQKFSEYIDLIKLKEAHPEFNDDVFIQLRSFAKDTTFDLNYDSGFSVENIKSVGAVEKVSDSVDKIKLTYKIISETHTVTDSVFAHITSKTIVLDGQEMTSNKVKFSKE